MNFIHIYKVIKRLQLKFVIHTKKNFVTEQIPKINLYVLIFFQNIWSLFQLSSFNGSLTENYLLLT